MLLIQGPFPWPFVGNVGVLRKLTIKLGGQHEALYALSRQFGSPVIKLRLGNCNTFVVSGSRAINQVLNSEEFDGRPWNYFISMRNMGKRKGNVIVLFLNDYYSYNSVFN